MKTTVKYYEASIYIGSHNGYIYYTAFSEDELLGTIANFQRSVSAAELCSLRVTPTTYIVKDYIEKGWEITAINYPRFPKSGDMIKKFVYDLANYLLKELEQCRISFHIPWENETVMLTSDLEGCDKNVSGK